jgi:hypothetical protein
MSYFYRRDQLCKAGDWDESKHPRDDRGRFAGGAGGGIDPDKYAESGGAVPKGLRDDPERNNFHRHVGNMADLLDPPTQHNPASDGYQKTYDENMRMATQLYGKEYADSVDKAARAWAAEKSMFLGKERDAEYSAWGSFMADPDNEEAFQSFSAARAALRAKKDAWKARNEARAKL